MNLTLEITQTGFVVRYFGKKYFEYKNQNNPPIKFPYESIGNVYNYWQGTMYTKRRFTQIVNSILNDAQASKLFWLMIDTYTEFSK